MRTREPRCGVMAGATDWYRFLNVLGIVTFTLWNTETGVCASPCPLFVFFFLRAWNVAIVMSNFPGGGVFVGQMQFKDCMKKNSEGLSYRGIIISCYLFRRCSNRRAEHPAVLTASASRWSCCRKCFVSLRGFDLVTITTHTIYICISFITLALVCYSVSLEPVSSVTFAWTYPKRFTAVLCNWTEWVWCQHVVYTLVDKFYYYYSIFL